MAGSTNSPFRRAASKGTRNQGSVDPENDGRFLMAPDSESVSDRDIVAIPLAKRGRPSKDEKPAADPEFTVSPFRALLADRPRQKRSNEHTATEKTRRGVMYAAGLGLSQEAIAKVMGIGLVTLRAHYEDELFAARHVMVNDIQTNLFNIARDPNHKGTVQAGIFLLSKLGGEEYKEAKSKLELSGPDGKPLQIDQQTRTVDPTMLSVEQRDALREIMSAALSLAKQPGPAQLDGEYKEVDGD